MQLSDVLQLDALRLLTPANLSLASLVPMSSVTSVLIVMEFPGTSAPNSTISSQIMTSLSSLSQTQSLQNVSILRGGGYHEGSKGFLVLGTYVCFMYYYHLHNY